MQAMVFPVTLSYRPRRVLFLIDSALPRAEEALDAVLDFNVNAWGGRHNPIIPVQSGDIAPSYEPVIAAADPDVVYSFGALPSDRIAWLDRTYSPIDILIHEMNDPADDVRLYSVADQATLENRINSLASSTLSLFGRIETSVLQLDDAAERSLSRFFRWNFGYSHFNTSAARDYGVKGVVPTSASDTDLLKTINARHDLAWNIQLCGDAPLSWRLAGSHDRTLSIYFGPDMGTRCDYWNDVWTTGRTLATGPPRQLWLTATELDDSSLFPEIAKLIRMRCSSSGSNNVLRLVSHSTPLDELTEIGKRIVRESQSYLFLQVRSYVGGSPEYGEREPATEFFRREQPQVEYVSGTALHLALRAPPVPPLSDGRPSKLMVNVHIDDPEQELQYANRVSWWRLPHHPGLAELFDRRAHRAVSTGELTFEITATDRILDIEVPTRQRLFECMLAPQRRYRQTHDARVGAPLRWFQVRPSEVGKYLSGINSLSDTLRDTFALFEHPFWRSLIVSLSQSEPSPQQLSKLAADAKRHIKRGGDELALAKWLAEKIILAARQMPTMNPVQFAEIEKRFATYVAGLTGEEGERALRRTDLLEEIDDLVRRDVLIQGVFLRCPKCFAKVWYSIRAINKRVVCRGCLSKFPFEAEAAWSYQLNELVRVGVSSHGLVPVVRTLLRIFHQADDSFKCVGPSAIYERTNDERKRICEVDLAWLSDGRLGVAEVKANTSRFDADDLEQLRLLDELALPAVVLLAAPEGKDEELSARAKQLVELGIRAEVIWWGPSQFAAPHYHYE
jgi:hypothetical protein